ncbi:4-hydroxythreonine-4-phosphate dehydrogenase PdxA [Pleomorphomonas sp. PLEO]|uniref:4-hydroxythreonine-4-phosphate dehydrogenase PdxA n=1 Tax=Pleomorphomonas sp. PLEO TaxID=3239306 RepID=UPI00351E3871
MPDTSAIMQVRTLAVSIGEPAGIGAEIIAKAWLSRREKAVPTFYVIADPAFLESRLARLGLEVPIAVISPENAADAFVGALPVFDLDCPVEDRPGELSAATAAATIGAIETAVRHIHDGRANGIVTAPIQKSNLYAAGFKFPGHTEFLGELARQLWPGMPHEPVMMLAGPELATVPVTVHIALRDVPDVLTADMIVTIGHIVDREMRAKFGVVRPRLAVAGLNPHAGEQGAMGREDLEIVAPAVKRLQAEGIDARGPLPSDTLFHAPARKTYDVVLAMYHDQALIPVKTIAFDETVNVTLGLPFIRTSPDHGTALDIAARGVADPQSMIAALTMAGRMAAAEIAT